MIISITELHMRSIFKIFRFFKHANASIAQVKLAPGNTYFWAGGGWMVAYTITGWESMEAMKNYRNSGAHKLAMKDMRNVSHKYRSISLEMETVPNKKEALKILQQKEYTHI